MLSATVVEVLTWVIPVAAAIAGAIGLKTALINRQTARLSRAKQLADAKPAELSGKAPEVRLPARLAHFVDRIGQTEEALAHLRAGERIVAVYGDSGVGKSAFATELAHRLCEATATRELALDGYDFIYVGSAGGSPSLADICREIALETGDQSLSTVADDAKVSAFWRYVARRRTVLVLDDLVVGPDAAGDPLNALLRRPPAGLVVLVSVNGPRPLDAGTAVQLPELEPSYALELISHETRRWRLGDAGLDDRALRARVETAVGGNPRLIEAFVRTLSQSPESVAEVLDAVERGEGVRQLLMPYWPDLPDDARAALAACAYLDGEATVEQIAIAVSLPREAVLTALAELLQVNLLKIVRRGVRPDVYLCSRGVHRATLAQTDAAVIEAFTSRLSAFYIRQLTEEPENAQWAVGQVSAIKAVLRWLSEEGDDARLQVLFASVLDLLFTLGLFDDRISTGQLAYESAVRAGNHRAASLAADVLSSTHAARGELAAAMEAVALGQLAAERSDDPGERARQLRGLGLTRYKAGAAADALELTRDADRLARETGDLEIVVNIQGLRTVAHLYVGEVDAAEQAARIGLATCEEMGWERAKAYPLRNLAEVAIQRGALEQAQRELERAGHIATTYADRRQLTRIQLTAAKLALFQGRPAQAREQAAALEREAVLLGLVPEQEELRGLQRAASRAERVPGAARRYQHRRPLRFTDAAIGGD